jgi:hypothetical protein
VRVTELPLPKPAVQVLPQAMPVADDVTVPDPTRVTVRVRTTAVKAAVTEVFALKLTTHEPVPEHPPPLQPVKV